MVYEQMYKDLISSTCQVSLGRTVVQYSLRIVNFLVSHNIDYNANIDIIPNFV